MLNSIAIAIISLLWTSLDAVIMPWLNLTTSVTIWRDKSVQQNNASFLTHDTLQDSRLWYMRLSSLKAFFFKPIISKRIWLNYIVIIKHETVLQLLWRKCRSYCIKATLGGNWSLVWFGAPHSLQVQQHCRKHRSQLCDSLSDAM